MAVVLRFVDHLVFRVGDLDRTERFYTALLGGEPQKFPDSLMWQIGETRLFFMQAAILQPPFDKERIGLNHLAIGVQSLDELRLIEYQLDSAGISNSRIHTDHYGHKEFIWLDDPDGMRIEFYLRPPS
jgi:glyoxylase I family protein